jgi:hypothetical protein
MAAPDNRNIIGEYITKVNLSPQITQMGADQNGLFSRECTRKTRMPEKSNHKGHEETQRKTTARKTNLGLAS